MAKPSVCVVGGGMITQVQIAACLSTAKTRRGRRNPRIAPGQRPLADAGRGCGPAEGVSRPVLSPHPSLEMEPSENTPTCSGKRLPGWARATSWWSPCRSTALHRRRGDPAQAARLVKPLVLGANQALEIDDGLRKGLVVGVEYHKRLDDSRALVARREYREGLFGEFKLGHAEMNEPFYYRRSNFMNWCVCDTPTCSAMSAATTWTRCISSPASCRLRCPCTASSTPTPTATKATCDHAPCSGRTAPA